MFDFGRKLKMAYLLMFVTLLHLITLAMLFIATMEKVVVIFRTWCLFAFNCITEFISATYPAVCIVSNLSSKSWWQWDGMENSDLWYNCRFDNSTGTWLCASSKETGKQQFYFVYHKSWLYMNSFLLKVKSEKWDCFLFQSGFRQCRSWWSSQWSSPRSPSWCSWVNCSPCPRVDSSTSLVCVKYSQVTVEWNNVPLTCLCMMRPFEKGDICSYSTNWKGKQVCGWQISQMFRGPDFYVLGTAEELY